MSAHSISQKFRRKNKSRLSVTQRRPQFGSGREAEADEALQRRFEGYYTLDRKRKQMLKREDKKLETVMRDTVQSEIGDRQAALEKLQAGANRLRAQQKQLIAEDGASEKAEANHRSELAALATLTMTQNTPRKPKRPATATSKRQ